MTFFASVITIWLLIFSAALFVPGEKMRRALAWILPALTLALIFYFAPLLAPWQRLFATSLGLLYVIKGSILLRRAEKDVHALTPLGLVLYMSIWPGMNCAAFKSSTVKSSNSADKQINESGARFARGFIFLACGFLLGLAGVLILPSLSPTTAGLYGIAALLMMVHFGYADMLTSLMRLCGWRVGPLFEEPFKSGSLSDFWSRRWNLAFVEMDRILFLKPLTRRLGAGNAILCVFVISGLLHDLCISYSAGSGWGLPTVYFILQGALVAFERRAKIETAWPLFWRRLWTWCWLLLPLPLLFTEPFRLTFILPLMQFVRTQLCAHSLAWYFDLALWCAAAGNFCTMGAGLQVPHRLHWREELAKLTNFNRKIFLNYAAYVLLMIISFGVLTIVLHRDLMEGGRAAVALSILMGCFWGLRVLVDMFWFKNEDWPKGPEFVIGHTCLTALFVALTATYLGLAVWHLWH